MQTAELLTQVCAYQSLRGLRRSGAELRPEDKGRLDSLRDQLGEHSRSRGRDERRAYARRVVDMLAALWVESEWRVVRVADLGGGGLAVEGPPLRRGQRVRVRLSIALRRYEFAGEVAWNHAGRVGIAFAGHATSEPTPESTTERITRTGTGTGEEWEESTYSSPPPAEAVEAAAHMDTDPGVGFDEVLPTRTWKRQAEELLYIAYPCAGEFVEEYAQRLRRGQIFAPGTSQLALGSAVELVIDLPGLCRVRALGEVSARILPERALARGGRPGLEIALLEPPPHYLDILTRYLKLVSARGELLVLCESPELCAPLERAGLQVRRVRHPAQRERLLADVAAGAVVTPRASRDDYIRSAATVGVRPLILPADFAEELDVLLRQLDACSLVRRRHQTSR